MIGDDSPHSVFAARISSAVVNDRKFPSTARSLIFASTCRIASVTTFLGPLVFAASNGDMSINCFIRLSVSHQ